MACSLNVAKTSIPKLAKNRSLHDISGEKSRPQRAARTEVPDYYAAIFLFRTAEPCPECRPVLCIVVSPFPGIRGFPGELAMTFPHRLVQVDGSLAYVACSGFAGAVLMVGGNPRKSGREPPYADSDVQPRISETAVMTIR